MTDRTRRTILERRRAFIAAAVASIGAVSACDDRARACLAAVADEGSPKPIPPAEPVDAGIDTGPLETGPMGVPCLSIAMPRDAGVSKKPKTHVVVPPGGSPQEIGGK